MNDLLLDRLSAIDPMADDSITQRIATLSFDDVEGFVSFEQRPSVHRWPRVLGAAAAVVAVVGLGAMVVDNRRSDRTVRAANSNLPPELLEAAIDRAPGAQKAALTDGIITDDELRAGGEAMVRCMTDSGLGPPTDWDESFGVRIPYLTSSPHAADACDREHLLWLEWARRFPGYGISFERDDVANVMMKPDATDADVAAVVTGFSARFPTGRVRVVDKAEARSRGVVIIPPELASALPDSAIPSFVILSDVRSGVDLSWLSGMSGVMSMGKSVVDDRLPGEESGDPSSTCSQLPRAAPAEVIGPSSTVGESTLEISIGASAGVKEGQPVISSAGLVGRVRKVSEISSFVTPLVNDGFEVMVQITPTSRSARAGDLTGVDPNTDPSSGPTARPPVDATGSAFEYGVLRGNGADREPSVDFIDNSASIRVGDLVMTRSSYITGSVFPGCIPIGVVSSVSSVPGSNMAIITVTPNTDFKNLSAVTVLLYGPVVGGSTSIPNSSIPESRR
jgi:cell shape-determining protein MreC